MNLSGTLLTLVNSVRSKLNDNSPSEERWSDVDIVEYLNTAEREIARRTFDLEDSATDAICKITVATGVATYSLSTKILFIRRIKFSYDNSFLTKRTQKWLDENQATWGEDSGMPSEFKEGKANITVTPIPTVTYNGYFFYLIVVRLPLVDLSSTNVTPEIGEKYYDDMVEYACYQAKRKRDADTFDPEGAVDFYLTFEKSVGLRPDANIERIMKSEPSDLHIQVRR